MIPVVQHLYGLRGIYRYLVFIFFFFKHTPTSETYTLSLHDALPILSPSKISMMPTGLLDVLHQDEILDLVAYVLDRKSTRLNSSHVSISYAVFCLKKKKSK